MLGDEPSIPTANIDQIIELLKENSKNQIVTLCEPITDKEEFSIQTWLSCNLAKRIRSLFF